MDLTSQARPQFPNFMSSSLTWFQFTGLGIKISLSSKRTCSSDDNCKYIIGQYNVEGKYHKTSLRFLKTYLKFPMVLEISLEVVCSPIPRLFNFTQHTYVDMLWHGCRCGDPFQTLLFCFEYSLFDIFFFYKNKEKRKVRGGRERERELFFSRIC